MSEYQISLTTRDGHELSFACSDDCGVVSAAEQADIKLPSLSGRRLRRLPKWLSHPESMKRPFIRKSSLSRHILAHRTA
ncbi:hypothetical protein [Methylomonas sp. MgM2]